MSAAMAGITRATKATPLIRSLLIKSSSRQKGPTSSEAPSPQVHSEPAENCAGHEMIIHADLEGLDVRVDGGPAGAQSIGGVAEVEIVVLELGRPTRPEHPLNAHPGCISRTGVVDRTAGERAGDPETVIRVHQRGTALGIDHPIVDHVSQPPGESVIPVLITVEDAAGDGAGRRRGQEIEVAARRRPRQLSLGTDQPGGRELVIVTELQAAD